MFGDDFKKSLEPIKTSDELLERTRKAIEAARYEQAKASMENTPKTASARSSRRTHYMKALIPVLAVLLLVGGAILLVPALTSNSTKKDEADRRVKSHGGDMYATVASVELAENLSGDNIWEAEDTTIDSYDGWDDNLSISPAVPQYFLRSPDMSSNPSINLTLTLDGKELKIKDNSLVWSAPNKDSDEPCSLPDFPILGQNDSIVDMYFDEDTQMLWIQLSINGTDYYYSCDYEDGEFKK